MAKWFRGRHMTINAPERALMESSHFLRYALVAALAIVLALVAVAFAAAADDGQGADDAGIAIAVVDGEGTSIEAADDGAYYSSASAVSVTLTYSGSISTDEGASYVTVGESTYTWTAEDDGSGGADDDADADDGSGDGDDASTQDADDAESTIYTCTLELAGDGTYAIEAQVTPTGTDASAVTASWTLVMDATAPTVALAFDTVSESGIYGERTATLTVTDDNFDASAMSVTVDEDVASISEDGWQEQADDSGAATGATLAVTFAATGEQSVTVSGDDLSISGADALGNALVLAEGEENLEESESDAGTFVLADEFTLDPVVPTIDIELPSTSTTGYYNASVEGVAITVTDNESFEAGDIVVSVNGEAQTLTWTALADGTYGYTATLDALSSEGAYTLSVSAADASGNEASAEASFTIDTTAPELEVSFDDEDTGYDPYYSAARTATLAITEDNFDATLITVTVDGEEASVTWSGSDGVYTAEVSFDADGEHSLVVSGTDAAGNALAGYESGTFTIDTTAPELDVTWSEGEESNGFYAAARTATVTILEENFDEDAITVSTNGTAGTWSSGGSTHTLSVTFAEGTGYYLDISGADLAGNALGGYESETFGVDTTAPVLSVAFDEDYNVANTADGTDYVDAAFEATVTIVEDNFDEDAISVSTNGSAGTWSSDGSTHTLSVAFEESADAYYLEVSGTDMVGNALEQGGTIEGGTFSDGTYVADSFIVDMTAPVLSVVYSSSYNAVQTVDGVTYVDATFTATIYVREQNFDESLITVNTSGTAGTWATDGTLHTLSVAFAEGQEHSLSVTGTDLAAHGVVQGDYADGGTFADGTYVADTFTIDTTAPTVALVLNRSKKSTYGGADYFNADVTLTATVTDANFDVDTSKVKTSGSASTGGSWSGSTYTVTYGEGSGNDASVTAYDLAGNKTTYAYGATSAYGSSTDKDGTALSGGTFTIDKTAPSVSKANVVKQSSTGTNATVANTYNSGKIVFYNTASSVKIVVKDALGLESAVLSGGSYSYSNTSVGKTSLTITVKLEDGTAWTGSDTLTLVDHAGNTRTWSISKTGSVVASGTKSSVTNTAVSFKKGSSSVASHPATILQDTVDPALTLTSSAEDGGIYTSTQDVSIDIEELNYRYLKTYDSSQAIVTVKYVEGVADGSMTTSYVRVKDFSGSGSSYGYAESFGEDGDYTVTAKVTDPATNVSSEKSVSFTVDKTAPTVTVTYDNDSASNSSYYSASRTATITIVEHNFSAGLISIDTTGTVGSWSSSGDTHTCTVTFGTDGVHSLEVTGADEAGNALSAYSSGEFTIDETTPAITFSGVDDGVAYNGDAAPAITFADETSFDASSASYTLVGTKNGDVTDDERYDVTTSTSDGSLTVSWANFDEDDPELDDIYTLSASVSDLAGNEYEDSITFSVNRYGSTYRVVNEDELAGYVHEAPEVVVEEVNVSELELDSDKGIIQISRDGQLVDADVGDESYTVSGPDVSTDDSTNGWSSYTYTLAASNFEQEGAYTITLSSYDAAANTNYSGASQDRETNSTEKVAVEVGFIYDDTAPSVDIVNVEDGGSYEGESYDVSIKVSDATAGVGSVTVTLDDEDVGTIELDDEGYGSVEVEESLATHTLSVVATDLAGNTSETVSAKNFFVNSNLLLRYLPAIIAGIVVALALVVLLIVLLRRRKRGEADEQPASE